MGAIKTLPIIFEHLALLSIEASNITSLEELACMPLTSMEKIYFYNNPFCSVKPLAKMKFPALTSLQLPSNCLTSIQGISKMQIKYLGEFSFETHKTRPFITSFETLAKIENNTSQMTEVIFYAVDTMEDQNLYTEKMIQTLQQKKILCISDHEA